MTRSRIEERLSHHGVGLVGAEIEALSVYYAVLYKWNARMNLTALADGPDAIDRLIVEPVLAAREMPEEADYLDVGSGGGSPALPVRATRPGFRSTLVESRSKKAAFLREAIRCMGLAHVRVEACRLEDLPASSTPFSLVTIRAVRMDAALLAAIERLVAPGASIWYFAGPQDTWDGPGGHWERSRTIDLLPGKQSRALCFTWNTSDLVDLSLAPE